jgi:hypothetical protein
MEAYYIEERNTRKYLSISRSGAPPLLAILIVGPLRRYYLNDPHLLRDQEHLADHVRSGYEGTFPGPRVARVNGACRSFH